MVYTKGSNEGRTVLVVCDECRTFPGVEQKADVKGGSPNEAGQLGSRQSETGLDWLTGEAANQTLLMLETRASSRQPGS